jgi:rhodanese-related sulfurtransferase
VTGTAVKLVDIRRPEEWRQTGVVEGGIEAPAFNANGQFLRSFVDTLRQSVQPDEEFVVICRTGNRTAVLSNWLATQDGYSKVLNHQKGITDWISAGLPVDKTGN